MSISKYVELFRKSPVLISAALIPLALPFSVKYTWLALWFLLFVWLVTLITRPATLTAKRWPLVLMMFAPVVILAFTLLYSSHPDAGWSLVERSVPLAMCGLIFLTLREVNREHINLLFWLLTISVFAAMCICLVMATKNFFGKDPVHVYANGNISNMIVSPWNYFLYDELVKPVAIHPTYLSMFVAMVIIFLGLQLKSITKRSSRALVVCLMIVLFAFMILLAARMALLSFIITGLALILLGQKRKPIFSISVCVVFVGLLVVLYSYNDFFRQRVEGTFSSGDYPATAQGWNSVNMRFALWECSASIVKSNWMSGVGAGDQDSVRNLCHEDFSFYKTYADDLNSHNQFLEYAVIGGVPLLCSFLFLLGYSFYVAFTSRSYLYLSFLTMFVMNGLTESVLIVFKGIVFFSLFNAVLLAFIKDNEEKKILL